MDLQDSRDALSQIRSIHDKHKSKLTGEKFLLKPNSKAPPTPSQQISRFFQSLFSN